MLNSIRFYAIFYLLLFQLSIAQNDHIISGKVTDGTHPVSTVLIRIQNSDNSTVTDVNGEFKLQAKNISKSNFLIASKKGYYNSKSNFTKNIHIEIILKPLPAKDNPSYNWIDPTPNPNDKNENCGNCHKEIYDQWKNSGHAQSASNSKFLNIYNGTDTHNNALHQPGYRLDHPYSEGNCANCHAPIAAIKNTIGININKLNKIEKMGISCDYCHKVNDIHLNENTSANTGVMMMELLRPSDDQQLCFGPNDDSAKPATFSSKISKSLYCAPCHQGGFWGLPVYETYSEWLNSEYVKKDIQCQNCHMPLVEIKSNTEYSKKNDKNKKRVVHSHSFNGPDNSEFLKSAIEMSTNAKIKGRLLEVSVNITNTGAGHHFPTGQPMRNMILIVEAKDANGKDLTYLDEEEVIPYWGGHGDPSEGNYEGLPGKGFAKVLFENYSRYVRLRLGVRWQHVFPAPMWRLTRIKSDNRIPALSSDVSTYSFRISGSKKPYSVKAKLIYRDTFKNWAKMKKWDLKDVILSEEVMTIKN